MTVELNVADALFADGKVDRVQMNQLADLKEAFIDARNRYAENFAEDELTEEICDQLAVYSSAQ